MKTEPKEDRKKKERKNRNMSANDVFAGAAHMHLLMAVFSLCDMLFLETSPRRALRAVLNHQVHWCHWCHQCH